MNRRATHDERHRTADLISSAFSKGQLSLTEFEERTDQAFAANDIEELEALLTDLGVSLNLNGQAAGGSVVPTPDGKEIRLADEADAIVKSSTFFGTVKRRDFVLSQDHEINATFGEVVLDLRNVEFTSRVSTITLFVIFSEVTIKVPEGVRVIMEEGGFLSEYSTRDKRIDKRSDEPLVLYIEGTAILSEVRVRIG